MEVNMFGSECAGTAIYSLARNSADTAAEVTDTKLPDVKHCLTLVRRFSKLGDLCGRVEGILISVYGRKT